MTASREMADQEVWETQLREDWLRALQGDDAAYRRALGVLSQRLRGYFRRRLGDAFDDAEDLVQETLMALHLHRDSYDPASPVGAWATAIARHKLVDRWRRQGARGGVHEHLDDVHEAHLPVAEPEGGTRLDLARLLARLPEAQQRAIRLCKLEGLSSFEAAAQTGVSESAIKVQVHRGLKKLAEYVGGKST
jgi:RNA polymerase sigma-70 factor, ECF subfamily